MGNDQFTGPTLHSASSEVDECLGGRQDFEGLEVPPRQGATRPGWHRGASNAAGQVRLRASRVSGSTPAQDVRPAPLEKAGMIYTDELKSYLGIADDTGTLRPSGTLRRRNGSWANVHTNGIGGVWSLFALYRRTFHKISGLLHMDRYLEAGCSVALQQPRQLRPILPRHLGPHREHRPAHLAASWWH